MRVVAAMFSLPCWQVLFFYQAIRKVPESERRASQACSPQFHVCTTARVIIDTDGRVVSWPGGKVMSVEKNCGIQM